MNTIADLIEHWESIRCPRHHGFRRPGCSVCSRVNVYQICAIRARKVITVNPNTSINDIRQRIQLLHDNLVENKPENELEEGCLHGLKKALEQFSDGKLSEVCARMPEGWIYKGINALGNHLFHFGEKEFLAFSEEKLQKRDVAEIIRAMEVLS